MPKMMMILGTMLVNTGVIAGASGPEANMAFRSIASAQDSASSSELARREKQLVRRRALKR
jgi:hypothetical protein